MAKTYSIESFDLSTPEGRYRARKFGFDVPLRWRGRHNPRTFWSCVEKTDACWWWRGPINTTGYGRYRLANVRVAAHRWAWIDTNGPTPEGLVICHRCDNKLCVRPDHLFLGTQQDNVRDKVQKQRQARGEQIGAAKLTRRQVDEIRATHVPYKHGLCSTGALARRFDVSVGTIRSVVRRRYWL